MERKSCTVAPREQTWITCTACPGPRISCAYYCAPEEQLGHGRALELRDQTSVNTEHGGALALEQVLQEGTFGNVSTGPPVHYPRVLVPPSYFLSSWLQHATYTQVYYIASSACIHYYPTEYKYQCPIVMQQFLAAEQDATLCPDGALPHVVATP